jgi:hypothetical protein
LIVLRRKMHGRRPRLTNNDRWFLIQLYRWFPSILQVLTIIRPETLVRWLSLSQTSSGWRLIENRAMVLCDEGYFQVHWLDGCQSISVAGSARGRDLDIAAANKCSAADCS